MFLALQDVSFSMCAARRLTRRLTSRPGSALAPRSAPGHGHPPLRFPGRFERPLVLVWCARRGSTIFIPGTHKNNAQRQAIVDGAKYNDGRRDEMLAKVKAKYSMLSAGCAPPRIAPSAHHPRSAPQIAE